MVILNKNSNNLENKTVKNLDNNIEMLKEQTNNSGVVDYRYICIRKEHFDVSMIYLNYVNLKKRNNIEIIYKSPSIFLDGLYFKTPVINASQIAIFIREKPSFSSLVTLTLNTRENMTFINMMKSIDIFMSNYIARHAKHINNELNQDELNNIDTGVGTGVGVDGSIGVTIPYRYLKYESILKYKSNKNVSTVEYGMPRKKNSKDYYAEYEMTFKCYLDKKTLNEIEKINGKNTSAKYIITFNISNIYMNGNILLPLAKCNKFEIQP